MSSTSFDCVQHIHTPTHRHGGTLDLVITKSEQVISDVTVNPPELLSDHGVISWRLLFQQLPPITTQREGRCWKKVDKEKFRAAILKSELFGAQIPGCAADYFYLCHTVLQSLADNFAPVHRITVRRQRIAVWFDL